MALNTINNVKEEVKQLLKARFIKSIRMAN